MVARQDLTTDEELRAQLRLVRRGTANWTRKVNELTNDELDASVSLNVEWRDTPDEAWGHEVRTAQGRTVPATETVWMRSREVRLHAVDLDNGARFSDVPREVLSRLLGDIVGSWAAKDKDPGLRIQVSDAPELGELGTGAGQDSGTLVRGDLSAVAQWESGRGGHRLEVGADVEKPRWI